VQRLQHALVLVLGQQDHGAGILARKPRDCRTPRPCIVPGALERRCRKRAALIYSGWITSFDVALLALLNLATDNGRPRRR
jgi:hypothetical protein